MKVFARSPLLRDVVFGWVWWAAYEVARLEGADVEKAWRRANGATIRLYKS